MDKAYLLWMVRNNQASYLLILDSCENSELLFSQIAEVSRSCLSGKLLDIIPVNSSFGKVAIKDHTAFYSRN
ncbi:enhanced serine sensitivity protein SseB C-terminal domain-containing protein [Anaeromicropila herbilytica]|uniref:SseB protein C-terminal domain-containing protein n=1 Tax=Anaeromicropila herbilytica TaxID=2785025 RepID=A0A7R7EI29_9FIRM|nr:enhanced serine sensitivity protein SseB C-terminal domain-containing protein [Anaeromicropila herbilytica]BCN29086.1 hypothetical protein bsdtb5_03810 [Anaeromicropila herbilytica]